MERQALFLGWKIQHSQDINFPQIENTWVKHDPRKIFFFLVDTDDIILKFIWESKGPRITRTNLKKNRLGAISSPNFQTYS